MLINMYICNNNHKNKKVVNLRGSREDSGVVGRENKKFVIKQKRVNNLNESLIHV